MAEGLDNFTADVMKFYPNAKPLTRDTRPMVDMFCARLYNKDTGCFWFINFKAAEEIAKEYTPPPPGHKYEKMGFKSSPLCWLDKDRIDYVTTVMVNKDLYSALMQADYRAFSLREAIQKLKLNLDCCDCPFYCYELIKDYNPHYYFILSETKAVKSDLPVMPILTLGEFNPVPRDRVLPACAAEYAAPYMQLDWFPSRGLGHVDIAIEPPEWISYNDDTLELFDENERLMAKVRLPVKVSIDDLIFSSTDDDNLGRFTISFNYQEDLEPTPSEPTPSEQSPPEQSPPEQSPPEQSPSEQSPPEQSPPEQSPPEQGPSEQSPPEQSPPEPTPLEQSP